MSSSRLRQLERDDLDEQQKAVWDAIVEARGNVAGPFRVWLHSAPFTDRAQKLGALVRYQTRLDARLSELVILVTARAWDCQLEWTLHEPFALEAGLAPELLEAVRLGQYPEFEREDEQAVYDYAAELVYNRFVQERTFAAARDLLGEAGVVELTGLIGYYSMVAMSLNAFQVPLPKGTKPTLVDCPTFR